MYPHRGLASWEKIGYDIKNAENGEFLCTITIISMATSICTCMPRGLLIPMAIGHLEKVKRMVEEGYDCSEVLVQLAAVRSALDNTGKVILKDHMRHCMVDAVSAGDQEAIDDLCDAIDKLMK